MEKIIDKIRKLLALANGDGAADQERDSALRMAHALLAKHNLSMSDTDQKQEDRKESTLDYCPHAWARGVAMDIGKLYFCEYFIMRLRNGVRHYFVGLESNTITSQEMFKFVASSIMKEARKATKLKGESGSFERSFCKGAAVAVRARCYEIRKSSQDLSEETNTSTGTGLVLASLYKREHDANVALIAKNHKLKINPDRQSNARADAHRAGVEFGKTIPLNRQIVAQ